MTASSYALLLLIVQCFVPGCAFLSCSSRHRPRWPSFAATRRRRPALVRLSQHVLTSALEGLAQERQILSSSDWLPPLHSLEADSQVPEDAQRVPLYPLPTVYLPTGQDVNYTLQNIEPRNLQMAADLAKLPPDQRVFCAVLRATDTGRLAAQGCLMRVIDWQAALVENGDIKKVVLTCLALERVDVVQIVNPAAADLAYRLRQPREYLQSWVRRRDDANLDTDSAELKRLKIATDFNRVRDYLLAGIGIENLPSFARNSLAEALPKLSPDDLTSESFWQTAHLWQTLAYTLREGLQQRLATDRNELLIEGALRKGGPLNLPVHPEDLEPVDREQIVALEERVRAEWVAMGLEPTLDFQALLLHDSYENRLQLLSDMVARERERLLALALTPRDSKESEAEQQEVARKGAWFGDEE
jgi:Lon protease-like protein